VKKSLILVALVLITVCVVGGIGVGIRKEKSQCDIHALVLVEREMPDGWQKEWVIESPVLEQRGAGQVYRVFMRNGDKTAHHTVYKYSNRTLATLRIFVDNQLFFPSAVWTWRELEGTEGLPLCADQRQIRCGDSNDPYLGDRCTAVLRYGSYVSDFSSSVQERVMSVEEFKQIVLGIDARFCHCKK
jgi:hypothetical protein